jgi:hypothetical protein
MYLNRLIFFHDQQFRAIPSKSAPPIKEMAIKYRDNIVHYQYFRGNIKMLEKGGQVHLSRGVCLEKLNKVCFSGEGRGLGFGPVKADSVSLDIVV